MKDLKQIMAIPDKDLADDDHLEKPDITQKEYDAALKEIYQEHKDDQPVKQQHQSEKK